MRGADAGLLLPRLGLWLIAAGLFLAPLAMVISLALGGNHWQQLIDDGLWEATRNSLVSSLVAAVAAVVVATVLAVVLDRTDIPGAGTLRLFALVPLLIPPFVGAIAWAGLFGPNVGVNRWFGFPLWNIYGGDGVIFLLTLHSYPLAYLIIAASLRAMPADLEHAARISGAGPLRALRHVTLPLLRPALLGAFTLTVVSNLGDFGIPAIIGTPERYYTLATMVYRYVQSGTVAAPLQVVSTLGVVLLVLGVVAVAADRYVASRHRVQLDSVSDAEPLSLGRWRLPVAVITWAGALAITLGPLWALLSRALLPAPGVPFTLQTITLANIRSAVSSTSVRTGLSNSLTLSLSAAAITLVLGLLIGVLTTRVRSVDNTALTMTALLPLAVPGLIIAVGWLIIGRYTGTFNTLWVILGAYVTAFTALVVQAVRAPLSDASSSLEEAARVSGAGPLRAIVDTTARMALPAAVTGALLVLVTAVRELTLSVILVAPGTTTLGVEIFNLQQAGSYNRASALSLMFALVGITALGLAAGRLSPRRS